MARYSNDYGACEISTLPGSPQVAISHGVFVIPEYRGKGFGHKNMELRLKRLKELHYNFVICTVNGANVKELSLLKHHGWFKMADFPSTVTGHTVEMWGRRLDNK